MCFQVIFLDSFFICGTSCFRSFLCSLHSCMWNKSFDIGDPVVFQVLFLDLTGFSAAESVFNLPYSLCIRVCETNHSILRVQEVSSFSFLKLIVDISVFAWWFFFFLDVNKSIDNGHWIHLYIAILLLSGDFVLDRCIHKTKQYAWKGQVTLSAPSGHWLVILWWGEGAAKIRTDPPEKIPRQ